MADVIDPPTRPPLQVRAAGPADAPELARLRYDFRAELGEPNEEREAFVARCAAWMASRLAEGGAWRCWLAVEGERIVGHAWAQVIEKMPNPVDETELHAYVTNCYVLPEARGAGLGSRLLEEVLAWARGAGVDAVILWPSARARPLYLRHGFSVRDDMLALRLPRGGPQPED